MLHHTLVVGFGVFVMLMREYREMNELRLGDASQTLKRSVVERVSSRCGIVMCEFLMSDLCVFGV